MAALYDTALCHGIIQQAASWLALKPAIAQDFSRCGRRHFVMDNTATIKQDIKRLMVENLMLQISAEEINDDQPLFGPGSVGLDSVDALQLVVALDKTYGLKIADTETARQILQSVTTIAAAVAKHQESTTGKP
jgi:acyl carrier protein